MAEKGILCIGGVGDGQWIADEMKPSVTMEAAGWSHTNFRAPPPDALFEPVVTHSVYRRVKVELCGRAVEVLLAYDLRPEDMLAALLEGYRGKRS